MDAVLDLILEEEACALVDSYKVQPAEARAKLHSAPISLEEASAASA